MHIFFADILKSPTGIDKITNRYWPNRQPVLMKLYTKETSWQFSQYWLAIFGQYRLAIWSIPVGDLVNTGWQFGQ